jgi:hypothetical protein
MIAMLDTSHDLKVCSEELGCAVEQLLTPLTRFNMQDPLGWRAIENGGFTGLNIKSFLSLLEREAHAKQLVRFVSVPDILASARRTLELFDHWYPQLCQWPLALVAQDGQEDLPIPWDLITAIFIGGTTRFKMSKAATDIIRTAQAMGKWTHVGRVNDPARWQHFLNLNVDSVDGTGISKYSHMRIAIRDREIKPSLFDEIEEEALCV